MRRIHLAAAIGWGMAALCQYSLAEDIPATQPASAPASATRPATKNLSPINIHVVDGETGKPIPEFEYSYRMETASGEKLEGQSSAHSTDGIFHIDGPPSCEVALTIHARDCVDGHGYPASSSYTIRADDGKRHITVKLTRGAVVKGEVVDAVTSKPVRNAWTAPVIFTPPSFSEDRERIVRTDANGRFELHGVDPTLGIAVGHDDYVEARRIIDRAHGSHDESITLRIGLEAAPGVHGVVKDPKGQPIADVEIASGEGKQSRTGENGSFAFKSLRPFEGHYSFWLRKNGYVTNNVDTDELPPEGLSIVLTPCPVISGRVVNHKGEPVPSFTMYAGPAPEPQDYQCTKAQVNDPEGRFSIGIQKDGPAWIAAKASGYAVAEVRLESTSPQTPPTLLLHAGATVNVKAIPPAGYGKEIVARLVPARYVGSGNFHSELPPRQVLFTESCSIAPDGTLSLKHIAPGHYVLFVFGPGLTPAARDVMVGEADVQLERISLRGTGTVFGQIFKPADEGDGPWAFADGSISFSADGYEPSLWDMYPNLSASSTQEPLKAIPFKSDENGRFRIENVPVGKVNVTLPYHASADVICSYERTAIVVEGRSTEVRFFDRSGDWAVPVDIMVGDGSREQFNAGWGSEAAPRKGARFWNTAADLRCSLSFTPLDSGPASYEAEKGEPLARALRVVMSDVQPGKYRLRVNHGSNGLALYENTVETRPGMAPVQIRLFPFSISGWIPDSHEAQVDLIDEKKPEWHVEAKAREDCYVFRFVPPGTYSLYIHDNKAGWCRIPSVTLFDHSLELEGAKLQKGGSLHGRVRVAEGAPRPDTLYAVHSNGIELLVQDLQLGDSDEFRLNHLWPGEWTLIAKCYERAIASKKVIVKGLEDIEVDFEVK